MRCITRPIDEAMFQRGRDVAGDQNGQMTPPSWTCRSAAAGFVLADPYGQLNSPKKLTDVRRHPMHVAEMGCSRISKYNSHARHGGDALRLGQALGQRRRLMVSRPSRHTASVRIKMPIEA